MSEEKKKSGFIVVLETIGFILFQVLMAILKVLRFLLNALFSSYSSGKGWDDSNASMDDEDERDGLLDKGSRNTKLILSLAAVVIKADGKVDDREIDYVEQRFVKEYNRKTAKLWVAVLKDELTKKQDLNKLCRKVDFGFTQSTKIQLLHFLCGLVTRDGMLKDSEFKVLKQIGMRIKLPFRTLRSILALFNFITEEEAQSRQERKKEKKRSPKWFMDRAYAILEVSTEASDKEVKKAFRKLAVIHHPDKVSHMGESFQLAAKKKFQEILDAYELIKEDRGMT